MTGAKWEVKCSAFFPPSVNITLGHPQVSAVPAQLALSKAANALIAFSGCVHFECTPTFPLLLLQLWALEEVYSMWYTSASWARIQEELWWWQMTGISIRVNFCTSKPLWFLLFCRSLFNDFLNLECQEHILGLSLIQQDDPFLLYKFNLKNSLVSLETKEETETHPCNRVQHPSQTCPFGSAYVEMVEKTSDISARAPAWSSLCIS